MSSDATRLGAEPTYHLAYVWMICLVAAMGGLLFGYDWVVIGGAKPFYEPFFGLTGDGQAWRAGWAMSSALAGCLAGALLSGALSDRLGRKRLLVGAALLFTVSAVWTALANTYDAFIWARILGGIGIGLASNVSPMYIAESSPAEMRGRFVSVNQLTIVIGVLAAQLVNLLIYNLAPVAQDASPDVLLASWNGQSGWRWMFAAEAVPAGLFLLLSLVIPESPRWLLKQGRTAEAERVLARIGGAAYAQAERVDVQATLGGEHGTVRFAELLQPKLLKLLALGTFLAVFQQWCGINVIFNYAEEIFRAAGYDVSGMMFNIVITGLVNLAFTFVAIRTVDRWGRRPLMLLGAGGLTATYAVLGACYYMELKGVAVLAAVLTAIAIYAMTLAPITWVLLAEIFPNRIRGAALSLCVSALWVACFALTATFKPINAALGAAGTFWLYGAICLVGFAVMWRGVPETKGKSLEQIERELAD
jgi:SP family sugar porter-like MFS transporter